MSDARKRPYREGMALGVVMPDQTIAPIPPEKTRDALVRDQNGQLYVMDRTPMTGYRIIVL